MPRPGFRTITVKGEDYDIMYNYYTKLKESDELPNGIHSFAGFVDYMLNKYISDKEKLRRFASKITKVRSIK